MRTSFKTLVSKNATTWRLQKPLRLTINFYKKQGLPVITWKKKHSSKQAVSITYSLEKKVFAAAPFEGL